MHRRFRGFGKLVAGQLRHLVEVDLESGVPGEAGIFEDLPAGALRLGVPRELGEDGAAREVSGEDLRRDGVVDRTGDAPRVAADDALEARLDDAGRVAAEVRRVGLAGLDASDADGVDLLLLEADEVGERADGPRLGAVDDLRGVRENARAAAGELAGEVHVGGLVAFLGGRRHDDADGRDAEAVEPDAVALGAQGGADEDRERGVVDVARGAERDEFARRDHLEGPLVAARVGVPVPEARLLVEREVPEVEMLEAGQRTVGVPERPRMGRAAEEGARQVAGEFGEIVVDRSERGEQRVALIFGEGLIEVPDALRVDRLDEPAAFARGGFAHVAAGEQRGLDALDLVVEPGEVGVDAVAGVVEDLAETPLVHAPERIQALELQRLGALLEHVRTVRAERPRIEAEIVLG